MNKLIESKVKPVSVPFIVEWKGWQICGDKNKPVFGSYEFPAYGHDYHTLLSYALTRASKACKHHGREVINIQMKGEYDSENDAVILWRGRKIIKFPQVPSCLS